MTGKEGSLQCFMRVRCMCLGSISATQAWGPQSLGKSPDEPAFVGTSDQPSLPRASVF